LKKLHSTFASGWTGAGLLLLRVAAGMTLIIQAAGFLLEFQDTRPMAGALCIFALAGGGSLVLGFLTPIGAALAVLSALGITLVSPSMANGNFFSGNPLAIDFLVMALAPTLLGPGAYSLDAQLFGRRRIIIPRARNSQSSVRQGSPRLNAAEVSATRSHAGPSASRASQD
jgi:uncharacterized membrane protein YphA (DoxX/SURF4 family)